jgi:hypothetical protein
MNQVAPWKEIVNRYLLCSAIVNNFRRNNWKTRQQSLPLVFKATIEDRAGLDNNM